MKREADAVPKLTTQNEELSAKLTQVENDKITLSEQLNETQTILDSKTTQLAEVQETIKVCTGWVHACMYFHQAFFVTQFHAKITSKRKALSN